MEANIQWKILEFKFRSPYRSTNRQFQGRRKHPTFEGAKYAKVEGASAPPAPLAQPPLSSVLANVTSL